MADREKLIELHKILCKSFHCNYDEFQDDMTVDTLITAENLIANGVTIQRWIPVTERLPEEDVLVLCIGAKGGMFLGYPRFVYKDDGFAYTRVPNARGSRHATHWMPLPEAPKD